MCRFVDFLQIPMGQTIDDESYILWLIKIYFEKNKSEFCASRSSYLLKTSNNVENFVDSPNYLKTLNNNVENFDSPKYVLKKKRFYK